MFDFFVRKGGEIGNCGMRIGEEAQRCREKTEWWKVEDKGVKR